MYPETSNTSALTRPGELSYSCSFKLNKKQARKMRQLFNPLTRPAQVPPRKKVAWRLVSKWFYRYERPLLIDRLMTIQPQEGEKVTVRITDARIHKSGDHRHPTYRFKGETVTDNTAQL